jgi:hypothetical protein
MIGMPPGICTFIIQTVVEVSKIFQLPIPLIAVPGDKDLIGMFLSRFIDNCHNDIVTNVLSAQKRGTYLWLIKIS